MKKQNSSSSAGGSSETAMLEARKKVNESRITTKEIKATVKKLDNPSVTTIPDDRIIMFLGKLYQISSKGVARGNNILKAYKRTYDDIDKDTETQMMALMYHFTETFDTTKKNATKLVEKHPLWKKFEGMRGFTPYQLALLMSYIKDISRFDTPSSLLMYAGLGVVQIPDEKGKITGYPVTKANLARIKKYYYDKHEFIWRPLRALYDITDLYVDCKVKVSEKAHPDVVKYEGIVMKKKGAEEESNDEDFAPPAEDEKKDIPYEIKLDNGNLLQFNKKLLDKHFVQVFLPKEFKGFNTELAGRLFVIIECLIRGKGFFFQHYRKVKERLAIKAQNEVRVEERKGELYIIGKKNQSLKMYSHKSAMRRVGQIFVHLLYTEWRTFKGLSTRTPYPIAYLGHQDLITLEEVIAYDKALKNAPPDAPDVPLEELN